MKDTQFVACLDKSKIAVNHIYNFFEKRGYEIEDLQDNKDYYAGDIDCKITKEDRDTYVEIKTDFYKTKRNVCIETISNMTSKKAGWLYKTNAEFIIFYLVLHGEMYIIATKDLISLIKENEDNLQKRYTETTNKNNKEMYLGEILLLPIELLITKAKKYNMFNDFQEPVKGLI